MRQFKADESDLEVEVDGLRFAVRLDGEMNAPALMLSNSLSSDMSMWDDQIGRWSKKYRIVRYDQRGHGRTGVPDAKWSMDRLGRDAVAIIDRLGLNRVHWCGVSMGGMVGLWMAIHAPERLERLVVANTAAHMGPPSLWNDRIALARSNGMQAVSGPTIERWFPAVFRQAAPETIERMREMIERTPVAGYVGCCFAIRDMDLRGFLAGISTETLVIVGSRDPATTPKAGRIIVNAIPHAQLKALEAGHISNVEQPDQFAKMVDAFFAVRP